MYIALVKCILHRVSADKMNSCVDEDPLREMRSMILSAFPCPPLPQLALRESRGDTDVVSSHDMVAAGMQSTTRAALPLEVEQHRSEVQHFLLQMFNLQLDGLYAEYKRKTEKKQRDVVVDQAYSVMQDFTRRMIASYASTPPVVPSVRCAVTGAIDLSAVVPVVDARFRGLDDVCVRDVVHQRAVEHLVALRMVVGLPHRMYTREDLKDLSYRDVIERFFVTYAQDGEDEAAAALMAT